MWSPIFEHLKAALPKNWQQILASILVTILAAVASHYGINLGVTPPPLPQPVFEPTEAQTSLGWVNDPESVQAISETLTIKHFRDTPAGMAEDPLPAFVYLWQSYTKLFSRPPPSKNQLDIGSCVSFGTNNAVCRSLATQIVLSKGTADEYRDFAEEVTYGGSRVQIGNGKLGRGDGSVGAWAAQFTQKFGMVERAKFGSYDLSVYSVSTCRSFGNKGVPDALQVVSKKYPVKSITQVSTWDSAKKALASGYAIAVCSNQGFTMQRDANGICRASGSWGHCMCLDGYCLIDGKEYGHIENSWGPDAHTGPVGPGDPPPSGFWALSTTVNRMLAQGDSWAFSNVTNFPGRAKEIDWFVQVAPREQNRFAQVFSKEVHYAMSP